MRLAFVVAKYFEFGGMQRTMRRIAQTLLERDHEIEFFCGQWQGTTIGTCQVHQLDYHGHSNHSRMLNFSQAWLNRRKQSTFDCVVGFNKLAGLDIYYAGDPCLKSKLIDEKPSWMRKLPRYRTLLELERNVFQADAQTRILLISHAQKAKFQHQYHTEEERFFLLPPGIQKERLVIPPAAEEIVALRHQLGMRTHERLILTLGSGYHTKGVDRVIRALAQLPQACRQQMHYLVVGDGKLEPMRRLAKKLGMAEQVHFLGPQHNVALYYYSANILVHPARTENTGTTLLEAMVCGLPVLTTANCGFAQHIVDANAGVVLSHPFLLEQLTGALAKYIESDQNIQWSRNGKNYAQTQDLYSLIDQAANIIEAVASHA